MTFRLPILVYDKLLRRKMKNIIIISAIAAAFAATASAQVKKIESVYTGLSDKACKTIELNVNEGGYYRGICPGVGGYKLEMTEGDLRQTINIIAPNRKKYELDFQQNVSGGFSVVGDKAEWRVTRNGKQPIPFALIIRFNVAKAPDNPEQEDSYLIVTKITKTAACVVDVIEPTVKNQNVKARESADASATMQCKLSR